MKVIDSVGNSLVFNSVHDLNINENYKKVIENIYDNSKAIIQLHKDKNKINIGKRSKIWVYNFT